MVTTKGKARSKKRPRSDTDFLGCDLNEGEQEYWERLVLPKRDILVTKFFDRAALEKLGLLESVETFLGKIGLRGFIEKSADTYKRLTLEFLSTLGHTSEPPTRLTFRLLNKEHSLTLVELEAVFGEESGGDAPCPDDRVLEKFWHDLTHQKRSRGTEKASRIPHPGFRVIHRVLCMGFLGSGEPTNLTWNDLTYLWSMSPEGEGRPPRAGMFLRSCMKTRKDKAGKIALGGMITLIALHLGVDLSNEVKIDGAPLMTIPTLRDVKILAPVPLRSEYALLVGTKDKAPYLLLPRPDGGSIPVGPTNADLYIPTDPPELLGLAGKEVEDDHEEGQEMAATGAGGSSRPRGSIHEAAWRTMIEDSMEELRDELGHIRDQQLESLALQRSLSEMYTQMHPDIYRPPAQSIYDGIAERRAARETRARERARNTQGRPSLGSDSS